MLSHSSLQHAKACKGEQHSAAAAHHDKLYRLARRRSNLAVDGPSPTARILIITSVSWVALRFVQSYLGYSSSGRHGTQSIVLTRQCSRLAPR